MLKSSVAASAIMSRTSSYARMMAGMSAFATAFNAQTCALIPTPAIQIGQNIFTTTVNPATTPVINVVPQPVGLVLGWLVEINATLADPTSTNSYGITPFGPANALSQITFNDLSNVTRIQTTGWHLHAINSAK